jgi:hypothetical protein
MRRIRMQFWLVVMDGLAFCGMFGSAAYSLSVRAASNCVDYGALDCEQCQQHDW